MHRIKVVILLVAMVQTLGEGIAQGVSIGAAKPDSSALLDLRATQKGLLIPRLTGAERSAIIQPANALLIFNTNTQQFQVNLGTPNQPVWQNIVTLADSTAHGAFWGTKGNAITDSNAFLGTIGQQPLRLGTHNTVKIYIDSASAKVGIHTQAPQASLHVQGTDAIIVPVGTTAQRPIVPQVGMIRFNATIGKLEGYTATQGWVPLQ